MSDNSKYEIKDGIWKTLVVRRNFIFFIERKERVEVKEMITRKYFMKYYIADDRPTVCEDTEDIIQMLNSLRLGGRHTTGFMIKMKKELILRN